MSNIVGLPGRGDALESSAIGTNLKLKEDDIIKCNKCGGMFLLQTMALGRISPLQSPDGRPGLAQIPGPIVCFGCGNIMNDQIANRDTDPTEQKSGLIVK